MQTRGDWGVALLLAFAVGCDAPAPTSNTASAEPSQGPSGAASSSATPTSSGDASPSVSADQAAIKQVFLDYRDAIGTKKGEQAAGVTASRTIEYFEMVRKSALTSREAELRKQPVTDRFMVLLIRAKVEAGMLRKMDGRALFVHAVNEGMVGEGAQLLEPDAVDVNGDTAQLGMRSRGATVAPKQGFRLDREKGGWKLDVMSIANAGGSVEKMLAKIDPDLDVAMIKVAEQLVGKPLAKTIWLAPDAPP